VADFTRRIPTTQVHERLWEGNEDVETYDDFLRLWLDEDSGLENTALRGNR
jgi:hypothetical protein